MRAESVCCLYARLQSGLRHALCVNNIDESIIKMDFEMRIDNARTASGSDAVFIIVPIRTRVRKVQ